MTAVFSSSTISNSTCSRGKGWHRGIKSLVRLRRIE
jgi:hypothetical protein